MRRARIKAVATLPVRRKATQDGAATEPEKNADANVPDKPLEEKVPPSTEPIPVKVEQKEIKKICTPEIAEELPVSPVKEKETLESKVPDKVQKPAPKPEIKNNEPPVPKLDSPQRPPVSSVEGPPIKAMQNRSCFMRPTPRLDGGGRVRRNSVQGSGASASESEDDSRRSNSVAPSRVRNDSICSVQSLKDNSSISNIAKLNLGQKRRVVVSESARKLAEARREFLLKHENKSPDKSKLTMYDLIYYNPTSNPMKPKPVTARPNTRKLSVCSIPDRTEEEAADEPAEMLVPQVKVGPNGQLIIDEQSLVIDQYKAQENIDRSDIMVDEDTTGNGFYKRRQKSKEWNKWETLKFYKALNTYGTDFLLMQSIFPKRTRQELKLKYKKEERLHQKLVEKALQYQEFDTEALEKDLITVEESERKELESKKAKKETNSSLRKKRGRCQTVALEVNCDNDKQNEESNKNSCDDHSSDESARITITAKKTRKRPTRKRESARKKVKIIDENEDDNSDSEPETYKAKPTRSGRLTRKTSKVTKPARVSNGKGKAKTKKTSKIVDEKNVAEKENSKEIIVNDIPINENKEVPNTSNEIENSEILAETANIDTDSNRIENSEILSKSDNIHINRIVNSEIFNENINIDADLNKIMENSDIFSEKINMASDSSRIEHSEAVKGSISVETDSNKLEHDKVINESPDTNSNQTVDTQNNEKAEDQNKLLETLGSGSNLPSNIFDGITDDIPNMTNLKPGSLVVLKTDCIDEPGKTLLQVYVVSADYDANNPNCKDSLLPINLSPDILETVTNCIKDIEPENIS